MDIKSINKYLKLGDTAIRAEREIMKGTLKYSRHMTFSYTHKTAEQDALALDEKLRQSGIDFVRHQNATDWQVYVINRSGKIWSDIMSIINSVHAPRYRYINTCVKGGVEYSVL